jgi:two-component system, chemotaxis family, protein-glutamate methylesterase/glutaminase
VTRPIRVLVADDSAFARKVLREVLQKHPNIEVVDIARDGLDALEKIAEHAPDVVVLDLLMPNLDGVGVLKALPAVGAPAVVVVSTLDEHSELCREALASGAAALVHKPTALATDRLYELSNELVQRVIAGKAVRMPVPSSVSEAGVTPPHGAIVAPSAKVSLVVIGTSTGGPQALTRLLSSLPADFPVPIVTALHIPAGYTASLARRIDQASAISVVEASDDLEITPGVAAIAPGGTHLMVERRGNRVFARFAKGLLDSLYCPSVNVLFESAAAQFGAGVLGVVLTGMGDDGLAGARAIRKAGGTILTESESSCIVYGMPRCVNEAGLAATEAPIETMGKMLLAHL